MVESDHDNGCCFNEPIEKIKNVTKYIDVKFHEPDEIWTCKTFTRRNETCFFGPDNCTYTEKCVDKCKFVELPGKCSNVSHVIPGSCHEWCEGKSTIVALLYYRTLQSVKIESAKVKSAKFFYCISQ